MEIDYKLKARQAHNEKAGHHPNSAEYSRLTQLVSDYWGKAIEAGQV